MHTWLGTLVETSASHILKRHRKQAVSSRGEFQAKNKEFNNVLRFLRKYLEVLVGEAMRNQKDLSRKLETVQQQPSIESPRDQHELARATRQEHVVSSEIATASKDIAVDEKKDGPSMKT